MKNVKERSAKIYDKKAENYEKTISGRMAASLEQEMIKKICVETMIKFWMWDAGPEHCSPDSHAGEMLKGTESTSPEK